MEKYTGPIFDADNHYYEAHDAFTRHVPKHMQPRCVQWVQLENGRKYHVVAGKISFAVGNPTFNPISKPGALREYYHGNPRGKKFGDLIRESLEPMPPEYMDRDKRVERVKEQGLEATWLFPTAGILYEEALSHDTDALCATCEGFNRWLDDDWGLAYKNKIFCAPYFSLADVDWACRELEWALKRGARVIVMRPHSVRTRRDGSRSPGDEMFDPFWARVNEAGITVVAHVGSSGYTANGYARSSMKDALGGGERPTVASLNPERAINDWLLTLAFDKMFERFPNLRVCSVENGSAFLRDLFVKLGHSKQRLPKYYKEDPCELFRKHVWINPFWEDDIAEIISMMGPDRVIFGSDWPHMEGLEKPLDIYDELKAVSVDDQKKFLYSNAAALNELRPL